MPSQRLNSVGLGQSRGSTGSQTLGGSTGSVGLQIRLGGCFQTSSADFHRKEEALYRSVCTRASVCLWGVCVRVHVRMCVCVLSLAKLGSRGQT